MNIRQITARAFAFFAAALLLSGSGSLNAQTTAFSYQGQLNISNAPATGSFDFQFSVYDGAAGSNLIAGPLTNTAAAVSNGIFTVQLDFGADAFTGPPRWLQIGVRPSGDTNAFSVLSPLQQVLAAPYAITANSASNLLGAVPAVQVSGTLSSAQLPSTVVLNNDTGVTLSGTFSGNGSGLTSLNAASLTGPVPSGSLTSVPASSLTGAISAGQLPSSVVINGQGGVTLSGSFSGNGAGLSGINAAGLSGTLSLGQLPGSVLVNGASSINLSGSFSGFFSGNGNGLNSLNAGTLVGAIPASAYGVVPAANLTGTVPSGTLAGTYGNVVSFNNQGNTISGNGAGLTNLTATNLTGIIALINLPGNVFTIFTNLNTLSIVTNLTVIGTDTVATLIVTNSALFTNSEVVLTNTDGHNVVINDGNISLTGIINGNASGLTNAAGASLVDATITNALNASLLNAGNALTNYTVSSILLAAQEAGAAATNFAQSLGASISNYAQSGNLVLSNYVSAGATLPKDSLITNAMLVGPSTNAGGFWVTNGALFVTNVATLNGVILSSFNGGIAASNVTISGVFTGNGSGLTDGLGNPLGTAISNLALSIGANDTNFSKTGGVTLTNFASGIGANDTNFASAIGASVTNFAINVIGANATNFTLSIGANDTNFAQTVGANDTNFAQTIGITLTNFASAIGANDTNFTKSIGVTISNYAQAGSLILSNYVAAGGTLPKGSLVSNVFLVGPSTNEGAFWVTNGNVTVSNGAAYLVNAAGVGVALNDSDSGNISFSGIASGDGAGLTSVNAAMLESLTTNNFWLSGGNSGLTEAGNFLGTIDNVPLAVKVDSQQALLVVPDNTGNGVPTLIGGSTANTVNVNAYGTVVGGGTGNGVGSGSYLSFIGGGNGNSIGSAAFNSAVAGGNGNTIQNNAYESFIGGGLANSIQSLSSNSFIGGGNLNVIQPSTGFSSIGGGYNNSIQNAAGYSSIGGGYLNVIAPNAGYSAIGGGQNNSINAAESVVGGGNANSISATAILSVVGGGAGNSIGSGSDHSTICGGQANSISASANLSAIAGGSGNSVTGSSAVVAGGTANTATTSAFAAGTDAQAVNQGAFVWADSSTLGVASTNSDSVTFLAHGGYRLYSGPTAGVFLASGTTAWATISDRNAKKNITPVDPLAVLKKLAQVPVDHWNYKWETDDSVPHIGPMAQDFKRAFYPGRDDKSITTLEFDGVELAAIQGLNTKVEEQDATVKKQISEQARELKSKDAEIQSLKERLERLEKLMNVDKN